MKFSLATLTLFATSSLALAAPLASRDSETNLLVTDLLRLDRAIRNITYAAGNYTGGAAGYQAIRESFAQVNYTNRVAYYDGLKIAPRKPSPEHGKTLMDIISNIVMAQRMYPNPTPSSL